MMRLLVCLLFGINTIWTVSSASIPSFSKAVLKRNVDDQIILLPEICADKCSRGLKCLSICQTSLLHGSNLTPCKTLLCDRTHFSLLTTCATCLVNTGHYSLEDAREELEGVMGMCREIGVEGGFGPGIDVNKREEINEASTSLKYITYHPITTDHPLIQRREDNNQDEPKKSLSHSHTRSRTSVGPTKATGSKRMETPTLGSLRSISE